MTAKRELQVTNYTIALIGVRILGLFFLVQGIVELRNIYFVIESLPYLNQPGVVFSGRNLVAQLALVGVPLALGAMVLGWSRRLASWIVPARINTEKSEESLDTSQLHGVAFSILGVLMVWRTLPNFLATWSTFYEQRFVHQVDELSGFVVVNFVSHSFLLAFGIALFAGRGFFVRLFQKCRDFGLD